MDKNKLEELKNMSKEEREAYLKAHKDELGTLSQEDLNLVNGGGCGAYEEGISEVYYLSVSERVIW